MGLRDYMNNNSSVVTILAVVVLVIALGIIVMTSKGPGRNSYIVDIYFYDLNTGKLFIEKSDQRPPITTASGPTPTGKKAGVLAYVSTCGECRNYAGMGVEELKAAGAFISRLEMFTEEALAAMDAAAAGQSAAMDYDLMNAVLIKRVEDTAWVPIESSQGMRIMSAEAGRCPGGREKTCLPGM